VRLVWLPGSRALRQFCDLTLWLPLPDHPSPLRPNGVRRGVPAVLIATARWTCLRLLPPACIPFFALDAGKPGAQRGEPAGGCLRACRVSACRLAAAAGAGALLRGLPHYRQTACRLPAPAFLPRFPRLIGFIEQTLVRVNGILRFLDSALSAVSRWFALSSSCANAYAYYSFCGRLGLFAVAVYACCGRCCALPLCLRCCRARSGGGVAVRQPAILPGARHARL
jgi:hypothetical protein